ncbi:MAG: hypothetical protein JWN01_1146 [Patescibacteria group bacterium]|nr:hypothetical protein [Patescibacteria group bacterium]
MGLIPSGKPHPTTKWSLLMALLVVVVLGVPGFVSAGQPAVQAPTGAQSGGVFTGTYTFNTYISCTSGLSYNSSYSNNLEGTHTFAFYGSTDGSLLVTIDGGGMMLINSCGDPFTPPHTNVANYTVVKDSTPPSPTPTPTPPPATPTPTANPGGSSGGGTGQSTGGGQAPAKGGGATPAPAAGATPTPTASPGAMPPAALPLASGSPSPAATPRPRPLPAVLAGAPKPQNRVLGWSGLGMGILALLGLLVLGLRRPRLRANIRSALTPPRLFLEPYWFRMRRWIGLRRHAIGHDLPRRRGLSAHHHSGKLLAHHHTSYPALAFLVLVATVLAAGASYGTQAASSVVSLTVTGPPPSTPATIDDPADADRFATNAQTIRGTCPSGLLVEFYRNTAFAGSGQCDINGLYAVLITLVPGQNDLVARDADALNQYGPDSNIISIFYDPPPPPSPTPTPSPTPSLAPSAAPGIPRPTVTPTPKTSPQPPATPAPAPVFLLDANQHSYQGADIGTPVNLTITLRSGRPPYHLTWQWGDNVTSQSQADAAGDISQDHTYKQPGSYQVTVRAVDALGRESVIQIMVVVNGPVAAAALTNQRDTRQPGNLAVAWPFLGLSGIVVLSFWLGERHRLSIQRPLAAALHY